MCRAEYPLQKVSLCTFRKGRAVSKTASLIALSFSLLLASPLARAFVGPPSLVPPNPVAGQLVSVAVTAGVCDDFTADPTTITRSGNNIHIILPSVSSFDPDFCFYPVGTAVYPVGSFPDGSYTLQVDRTYPWFNGYVIQPLGTLTFTVAPAASVPLLGVAGSILLGLVLVIAAFLARRGRRFVAVLAIVAIVAMPLPLRSQTPPPYALQILLSAKPGAPTPDALVGYFQTGAGKLAGPLPLAGLADFAA